MEKWKKCRPVQVVVVSKRSDQWFSAGKALNKLFSKLHLLNRVTVVLGDFRSYPLGIWTSELLNFVCHYCNFFINYLLIPLVQNVIYFFKSTFFSLFILCQIAWVLRIAFVRRCLFKNLIIKIEKFATILHKNFNANFIVHSKTGLMKPESQILFL